ncbi:cytochrome P450 3A8-like [Gigantopelta aegis]|uniref:cytochrome P450 3A8-like n=1 Tax=Gigantopelta aegis TaxID=1735272 RepID=UPI001B88C5FC|nr:cytochrome P450 3A8-like [Gigantopelta aegis]
MNVIGLLDISEWTLVVAVVVVSYVTYMSWTHGMFRALGIKGPTPLPVLGNSLVQLRMGIHGADVYHMQQYGHVYGSFETRFPVLVVSDAELLKHIMVKDFNNFPNRRDMAEELVGFPISKSLIFTKDDHWRFIRNFITPAFSGAKLKRMVSVLNGANDVLLSQLTAKTKVSAEIDIKKYFEHFIMDFISQAAFGMETQSQLVPNDPFAEHARQVLNCMTLGSPFIIIATFFPFLVPLMSRLGFHLFAEKKTKFFVDVTKEIIAQRKNDKHARERTDFIQVAINAEEEHRHQRNGIADGSSGGGKYKLSDGGGKQQNGHTKGLTDDEINAQALLFFLAGYDTSSTTLSLVVYNLATHPDVQDKLLAEIDELLPEDQPNYDNISKLEYLDMCVSETLRIYPPGLRADRTALQDTEINGVKIPKGLTVAIPIYAIHHDPERWENPEEFDPERFSPENKSKHGPFDYLPFGNGPRSCIGMRLAVLAIKVTLVRVFQKYRFTASQNTQIPLKFSFAGLLRPDKGVWLHAEERT